MLMVSFQVIYLWFRYNYNVVHITYLFVLCNINIFAYILQIEIYLLILRKCFMWLSFVLSKLRSTAEHVASFFYKNPQIRKNNIREKMAGQRPHWSHVTLDVFPDALSNLIPCPHSLIMHSCSVFWYLFLWYTSDCVQLFVSSAAEYLMFWNHNQQSCRLNILRKHASADPFSFLGLHHNAESTQHIHTYRI